MKYLLMCLGRVSCLVTSIFAHVPQGALTHGDRRSVESRDLSKFNIENKYGKLALEVVVAEIIDDSHPRIVRPPVDFPGDFYEEMAQGMATVEIIKRAGFGRSYFCQNNFNVGWFLNRLLGMPVHTQNALFQYFSDHLEVVIEEAIRTGRYDAGILDLTNRAAKDIIRTRKDIFKSRSIDSEVLELHQFKVERGVSWDSASKMYAKLGRQASDGFHISKQVRSGKRLVLLAISDSGVAGATPRTHNANKMHTIYRPNTGLQPRHISEVELQEKYNVVPPEKAKETWEFQYRMSETVCQHASWSGSCKARDATGFCGQGLRQRTYHVLKGSVLQAWDFIETVIGTQSGVNATNIQVLRVEYGSGHRLVGLQIPNNCAEHLRKGFEESASWRLTSEDSSHSASSEEGDKAEGSQAMCTQELELQRESSQASCRRKRWYDTEDAVTPRTMPRLESKRKF